MVVMSMVGGAVPLNANIRFVQENRFLCDCHDGVWCDCAWSIEWSGIFPLDGHVVALAFLVLIDVQ